MLNSDVIFMGIKWRKIVIREWDVVLVMMGMCYIWEEKKEILLDGNIQIFVNKMKSNILICRIYLALLQTEPFAIT